MKTYIINIKTREDRRLLMDIQLRANGFEIEEEGKKNERGYIAPDLRVEFTTHWPYNKVGKEITDGWLKENGFGLFDWESVKNTISSRVNICFKIKSSILKSSRWVI